MSDIFISYSSSDRPFAKMLAVSLEQEGCSVWWDRQIPVGTEYDEIIQEKLNTAKCVIVIWTAQSVKSHWVRDEATDGLNRKILAPVLMDTSIIPMGFRQVQTADLRSWKGKRDDEQFRSFISDVKVMIGLENTTPLKSRRQNNVDREKEARRKRRWLISMVVGGIVMLILMLLFYRPT